MDESVISPQLDADADQALGTVKDSATTECYVLDLATVVCG